GNFNGTFDQVILDAMLQNQDAEIAFSPGFRWGISKLPGETVTFEDLMSQTAITYPAVTMNHTSGEQIKNILEDVADNLFNKDPYYQQGGDMVRVGGLKFSIDPTADIGKRIDDMTLNGKTLSASKKYKVAGWASVQEQPEDATPIWDVVASYMRDQKIIKIKDFNEPVIKNLGKNPGYIKI
ncbi:MAG: 5'-nucleotidase C-terminal domain-containing protein, partial [Gammaproteobacteria bacterium]|nr:5'-nucleotidase C-terminal domain-containing protein [Gammaproteobacteria bacterium]